MGLTLIPEKTEDSLGIVKTDVLPYTDPETQVPAVQFERLKDAVIANATAIGLGDGSTPGSLAAQVASMTGAIPRIRVCASVTQVGLAERSVGMLYFAAGQTLTANAMIGAGSSDHEAVLRLRRFTGGAEVATWNRTGTMAPVALETPLAVANSDWYELTIAGGDDTHVAHFAGFDGSTS